jgi:hypothetical protein
MGSKEAKGRAEGNKETNSLHIGMVFQAGWKM